MELNSGRYLLSCEAVKSISATFADTEVKNYFSIYYTNTKKLVQFFQDTKKNCYSLLQLRHEGFQCVKSTCVAYINA